MCEHIDYVHTKVPFKDRASMAEMWRAVYLTAEEHDCPCFDGTGCCVAGKRVPQDRIILKECGCCQHQEFTEVDDYICLFCRYYDPATPLSIGGFLDKAYAKKDLEVKKVDDVTPFVYDTETMDWQFKIALGEGCRFYSPLYKKLGW